MKKCNFCGIDIASNRKFCDRECYSEYVKSKRIICVCEQCDKVFEVTPSKFKRGQCKFCSQSCSAKFRINKIECICENCGEIFEVRPYIINKNGGGRFCSNQCRFKVQSGINHPAYTGGSIDPRGYRQISIGGKRIGEHRLVMEQYLGRELTEDEVVHHINEIRDDNDINNLQLMTRGEHCSHHRLGNKI